MNEEGDGESKSKLSKKSSKRKRDEKEGDAARGGEEETKKSRGRVCCIDVLDGVRERERGEMLL
jgi:hypothetical protein